jgi:hypothetical protein
MTDNISYLTRRARGYWYADGLAEIGSGILLMLLSIPYLLWGLAPQGSAMAKLASSGKDVVLLLGLVVLFMIVQGIKQRSTYPRTGYVEDQRPGRKQILTASIIGVAGVLVFAGLMIAGILLFPVFRLGLFNILAYLPTIFGFIFALIQVVLGFRTGLKRFYVLAGMAALTSLGLVMSAHFYLAVHRFDWTFIANSGPNDPMLAGSAAALTGLLHYVYMGAAIFFAVQGLVMLVSGLVVRRIYLRQNPFSQEEIK